MSDDEVEAECKHRRLERIGIIMDGDDRAPTPFELNIAAKEAAEWRAEYRSARPEDREP
jgi:hypothetical protein